MPKKKKTPVKRTFRVTLTTPEPVDLDETATIELTPKDSKK